VWAAVAALLVFAAAVALPARAQTETGPWCPAAVIGAVSSISTPPSASETGIGEMSGGVGAHVSALRVSLSRAVSDYASALSRLASATDIGSAAISGETARYVDTLRSDLRAAMIEATRDSALAGPAELAIRSAAIDTLLARIHAYEKAYGRGPGEPTSAFNVLEPAALDNAIADLERARTILAFEIATSPSGRFGPTYELRLKEIVVTLTDLEAERYRRARTAGARPQLLSISGADGREAAQAKSAAISRVDSSQGVAETFSRKLLAQVAMRSADQPEDANLAALRRKLFGLLGPDKLEVARDIAQSFRGRGFPDWPGPPGGGVGPNDPGGPPAGGGASDPIARLRSAALAELEARRIGNASGLAQALAQFDANERWLAAGLPRSWRHSALGFSALSDSELRALQAGYQKWIDDLGVEAGARPLAVQKEQDLIAARTRLAQLRSILDTRAGTGWLPGEGPSARGPPVGPEELARVWRANAQSVSARVAQVMAPAVAAKSETAERAADAGLTRPSPQQIAQLRLKELQAEAIIIKRVSAQLDAQLAQILASEMGSDFDLRRSLAAGLSDLATAKTAFAQGKALLTRTFPQMTDALPDFSPSTRGGQPTDTTSVALERAVAAAEFIEARTSVRMRLPISLADETKPPGTPDADLILGGLGKAPSSDNASFEKLFPKADWTRSLQQLRASVARMPGGIILAPQLAQGGAPPIQAAYRDSSGAISIAISDRLYRTNLTATDAEWRNALAFVLDQRLIAIDIRGLSHGDAAWILANTLPDAIENLARNERQQLIEELINISAINLHPAFENGPWAQRLTAADTLVFQVLPHETTPGVGELKFAGVDLRPLRQAYLTDMANLPTRRPKGLKSVISASSAQLACAQDRVTATANLSYAVYADEQMLRGVSAWLGANDQALRRGSPDLQETARLADLVSLVRNPDALKATLRSVDLTGSMGEPTITPKFLCSERRYGLRCDLNILRSVQYGENR
jgi:hypothetical protein